MPSLVVKLPLPERFGGPKHDHAAAPTPSLQLLSPMEIAASLFSSSGPSRSRVTSLTPRLHSGMWQLRCEDGAEVSRENESTGPRTNETIAGAGNSASAVALLTSPTAYVQHLNELDAFPDGEKSERIDKRKRMIEALDHYEKETLQSSTNVFNDDKKRDSLKKHMDMINNEMKAACADLTTVFLSYLDNFGSPHFPETTTLDAIEDSLLELIPSLSARPVGKDCIDRFPVAVAVWLTYRRTVFSVQTAHTTALLPSQMLSPFTVKIKNSCLITRLRKAHRDYLATETGGLRVYEILVGGFVALQDTFEERRRRIEMRVREGLEGLERSLVGLGDELGKGVGRWVVGWE